MHNLRTITRCKSRRSNIMTVAFTNQNLEDYAARVASMTDDELMVEGQQLHKMVYRRMVSGTGPSSFELKLEICRKEYRKRHPKS